VRVVVVHNNGYGRRFADHLGRSAPPDWRVSGYGYTRELPAVIDEPREFVPGNLPRGDLLLYVGQDRRLAVLLPELTEATRAEAVLAPVDDRAHLPRGLQGQLKRALDRRRIPVSFPSPFCALARGRTASPLIDAFAAQFGRPWLDLEEASSRVVSVTVVRGAPCGNTAYVAAGLIGAAWSDLDREVARLFHAHPCLGSMARDPEQSDTILHLAGHLITGAVRTAHKRAGRARPPLEENRSRATAVS
jgi:hypothetical protein